MDMELFPTLGLGWLYGWTLICFWYVVQGLTMILVPGDVRKRLLEFDRSSWTRGQRGLFATSKLTALIYLITAALTPIKIDSIEFLIGLGVFLMGLLGLVAAVRDFKNTPLDIPVAVGLYKVSRHPQLVMLFILGIGLGIALSSWILLVFRTLAFGLQHAGVIAEENECVRRFGDSYTAYTETVPRYLIF